MQKVKNFSRFYALAKNIPGDREELKENLVLAFTNGRTISLRDMSLEEYNRMCNCLQESQSSSLTQKDFTAMIKKKRSAVLTRMQKLGINTSDWAEVDEFCLNPRIAGKEFRKITLEELGALIKKLESILSKPRTPPKIDPITDNKLFTRISQITKDQIPS